MHKTWNSWVRTELVICEPRLLPTLHKRTNSIVEITDQGQPPEIQHTHTYIKGYTTTLLKMRRTNFWPWVTIRWRVQGFVCCMHMCRAGSEAKEHHYGLNTTKTKHRLSGAPLSTRLRLWNNWGGGGVVSVSVRQKQLHKTIRNATLKLFIL